MHQADEFIFRVILLLRGKFQWLATCIGFNGLVQLTREEGLACGLLVGQVGGLEGRFVISL